MDEIKFEEDYARAVTLFRKYPEQIRRMMYKHLGECLFSDPNKVDDLASARANELYRNFEHTQGERFRAECFQRLLGNVKN